MPDAPTAAWSPRLPIARKYRVGVNGCSDRRVIRRPRTPRPICIVALLLWLATASAPRVFAAEKVGFITVAGAIGGGAGVLFAASNGPFAPSAGATYQLPVIASVILAGISLAGGRSRRGRTRSP